MRSAQAPGLLPPVHAMPGWNRAAAGICVLLLASLCWNMVSSHRVAAGEAQQAPPSPVEYSFGPVPQFEQRKLHAIWKPILEWLEQRVGVRFNLVSTLAIQDFNAAFAEGQFDFVYINPYGVVRTRNTQAYVPLVARAEPLRGIVVVRKDGGIGSPAELAGKTVAFPSPNALGAHMLVRSDLEQIHGASVTPLFVGTHGSVYLHVAQGLAAAGGGIEQTFEEQSEAIRAKLQVIYVTRPSPSHPIAAHPRVPAEIREKVREALLAMNDTSEGRELLTGIQAKRLIPMKYEDYGLIESWGLEKYWPVETNSATALKQN